MTRDDVTNYIKKVYKVTPDFPWMRAPDNAIYRHTDTGKWFVLMMLVRMDKLGLSGEDFIEVVTVKCEPMLIDSLVYKDGYHRAYHMNKTQWLTIELDRGVPDEQICSLIDLSFELTDKNKKKRSQNGHTS